MKKILLLTKLVLVVIMVNAQINFDNLEMPKYKNGSSGVDGFYSGSAFFKNHYNADYGSWAGFAVSKDDDTETSGFMNQYSAITGEGANASENYMASYVSSYSGTTYITLNTPQTLGNVKITNSTYAHNSMRDGDAYAKQFGGETGDDEDWFLLTIYGFNGDTESISQVEFYLADFRFADNSEDYIVDTWQTVDLSTLGEVDSLVFSLTSTDNGDWGMNTPSYFCLDDFETATETVDFEAFDFDYWNGSDLTGGFELNGGMGSDAYFHNNFTASAYGGYWNGFAYSIKNDITTEGYMNQYAANTGTDFSGNGIYAVGNGTPGIKFAEPTVALNMKVTNSTYATLSMQNGDAFAKQFGGDSGDEEDWFLLTIEGFNNEVSMGVTEFYLADYRFADNAQDYIVNTWETIDFDFTGLVDSLSFSLSSSDNGDWGMNTPAYFCMDELELSHVGVNDLASVAAFNVYPNPAQDFVIVTIDNATSEFVELIDINGKILKQEASRNRTRIDISDLNKGVYFIRAEGSVQKLIKE
jgi:hypothetical protein